LVGSLALGEFCLTKRGVGWALGGVGNSVMTVSLERGWKSFGLGVNSFSFLRNRTFRFGQGEGVVFRFGGILFVEICNQFLSVSYVVKQLPSIVF
jgi:hypothetical protein